MLRFAQHDSLSSSQAASPTTRHPEPVHGEGSTLIFRNDSPKSGICRTEAITVMCLRGSLLRRYNGLTSGNMPFSAYYVMCSCSVMIREKNLSVAPKTPETMGAGIIETSVNLMSRQKYRFFERNKKILIGFRIFHCF